MTAGPQPHESRMRIAPDHPVFAGHFPGAPVLPGALLAALVVETLGKAPELRALLRPPLRIDELKLLAPIRPGASLRIALLPLRGSVAFEVRDGTAIAARGRFGGGSE